MSIDHLSVRNIKSTSFTKPFIKGEEPWFPFRNLPTHYRKDSVLYMKGERIEDLDTGVIEYSWYLRMKNLLGATYAFTSDMSPETIRRMDLTFLEAVFKELGWEFQPLAKEEKVIYS